MPELLQAAYCRPLIAQRMAGRHPLFVNVLFGRDWARAKDYWGRTAGAARKISPFSWSWRKQFGDPWIAIGPRQFEAGRFDLRCVAGCWVNLHDGDGTGGYAEDCALLVLGAELARQAAVVSIDGGPLTEKWMDWIADVLRGQLRRWPSWWSDELEQAHARRFSEWQRAEESIRAATAAA